MSIRSFISNDLIKRAVISIAFLLLITAQVSAQQIITDGFTNTTLQNLTPTTTNVTTTTVVNGNAFNSFTKFNVDQGNTVNVVSPSGVSNIINIVKGQVSNINGTLNSVNTQGVISGSMYLVNPYGIVVGPQGVINTNRLIAVTPTKAFVDSFFDAPGTPNANSVNALINRTEPINADATVAMNGVINAQKHAELNSGTVNVTGSIVLNDLVNVGTLTNGNAMIFAQKNAIITGSIKSEGLPGANGGTISVTSVNDAGDVNLLATAKLSVKGSGANSNGGTINIAGLNANIDEVATLQAQEGDTTGNGGNITIHSHNNLTPQGVYNVGRYDNPNNPGRLAFESNNNIILTNNISAPNNYISLTGQNYIINNDVDYSTNSLFFYQGSMNGNNNPVFTARKIELDEINTLNNVNFNISDYINVEGGENITLSGTFNKVQIMGPANFTANNFNASGDVLFEGKNDNSQVNVNSGSTAKSLVVQIWSNATISNNFSVNGDLTYQINDSPFVYSNGTIGGSLSVSQVPEVTLNNVNVNGSCNFYVDKLYYGSGNVGSNFSLSGLKSNLLLGANGPLNIGGNANISTIGGQTKNQLFFYQGSVGKDLTVDANDLINIGNVSLAGNTLFPYLGNMYTVNNLPIPLAPDNNTFTVGGKLDADSIGDTAKLNFDGDITGTIRAFADEVNLKIQNTANIIADYEGIQAKSKVNITTINGDITQSNQDNYSITSSDITLNAGRDIKGPNNSSLIIRNENNNAPVNINAQANNNILLSSIYYYTFTMNINSINAINGDVLITNQGAIVNARPDNNTIIAGKNISINSVKGSVGTFDKPINIHLGKGGVLTGLAKGALNIAETQSDMIISFITSNGTQPVILTAPGNITSLSPLQSPNIFSNGLTLTSLNGGFIGTPVAPINVVSSGGKVNVQGRGGVYLNEVAGDLNIDVISTAGASDVMISSWGNILDVNNGANINVYGQDITLTSQNGSIGLIDANPFSLDGALNIALNHNLTGGVLNATAKNSIRINNNSSNNTNLTIDKVQSQTGDVGLKSNAGIIDLNSAETANIIGRNITLNAVNSSSIGTYSDPVEIDLQGGAVHAQGFGYIALNELNGDMNVNVISNAGRDNVLARVDNGSIYASEAQGSNPTNIIAKGLTLSAINGGNIGKTLKNLVVDTNYNSTGGKLTALATGKICVTEVDGTLNLDVASNFYRDDISFTAQNGNIINASPGDINNNIYGKNVILDSKTGSLGTADIPLELASTGYLNADSRGVINITSPMDKDLFINSIDSANNPIKLIGNTGIYCYPPAFNPSIPIILGSSLNITALKAIGTFANPVVVDMTGPINATSPDTHIINK